MIDPTRSQIDLQVAGGVADEEEEEEEEGKFPSSVLKDLHMVRQPHRCTGYTSTVFVFMYCTNSLILLGVEKNGLYLDEDTYMKLIAVDVVEFQCMALT